MSERHERRAGEIVRAIVYVTVATASADGEPWNSPVYAAYDENGNFYWGSSPQAQHSRNIDQNGKAFLVIYDSTAPEGTGEGVYVQAMAASLTDASDVAAARRRLARRAGKSLDAAADRLIASGLQRIYRARPNRVWMNSFENDDRGAFIHDIRVEIPVASLAGLADR